MKKFLLRLIIISLTILLIVTLYGFFASITYYSTYIKIVLLAILLSTIAIVSTIFFNNIKKEENQKK